MDIIPPPSEEQKDIVKSVINGNSIFIDAVAGSGKTTTVCHIGLELKNKNIILITYNNHLKLEVREKISKLDLKIEVHTYHSLAYKYYSNNCIDDSNLEKMLLNDLSIKSIKNFDIIIIDETQDMTALYYKLIIKFMRDNSFDKQIITLGDRNQGIYDFKDADTRFLTLSHLIYKNISKTPFINKTLKESYRLTKAMAWFVNDIMLNEKRIISKKNGPKVEYVISNQFTSINYIFKEIVQLIKNGFKYDDIFILSPSIKRNQGKQSPLTKLENSLVNAKIPCFVPINENAKLDNDIIKGKIIFTTFHQSKGRERKIVILFNFDDSYFKYYNRNDNPEICPPILYVASTRASYKLYVIEDPSNGRFKFIQDDKTYDYMKSSGHVNIVNKTKKIILQEYNKPDYKDIVINEFIKYLKQDLTTKINDYIDKIFIKLTNDECDIHIPCKIPSNTDDDLYEEVSDINSLTILSIWENKYVNNNQILNRLMEFNTEQYGEYIDKINIDKLDIKDYMLISNIYISIQHNYMFKLAQIKEYNWLNEKIVEDCIECIEQNIEYKETDIEIELPFSENKDGFVRDTYYIGNENHEIHFIGKLGIVTDNTVWEVKCQDKLKFEDFIKTIVNYYVWSLLVKKNIEIPKMFKILNIKTNEVWKINDNVDYIIYDVMKLLFQSKFGENIKMSNEEFLCKYKH
jgi:nucleoside-triphosphatase THEP1